MNAHDGRGVGATLMLLGWALLAPAAADYDTVRDSQVFAEVAALPAATREAALTAAAQPALLERVARLQDQSSQRLGRLLQGRTRAAQADVYAVLEVPGLAEDLAAVADGRVAWDDVAAQIPAASRPAAGRLAHQGPDLLRAVVELNQATQLAVDALLANEPPEAADAVRVLLAEPQVLAAMTHDLGATVLLARRAADDPQGLRQQLDEAGSPSVDDGRVPVDAGPYAEIAARYEERYAYAPPPEARTDVRVTAPLWIGTPYGPVYRGAWLGWYVTPRLYASVGWWPPLPRLYHPARVYRPARVVVAPRYRHPWLRHAAPERNLPPSHQVRPRQPSRTRR